MSCSDHEKRVAQKGKEKQNLSKTSSTAAVKILDKKIVVRGSKFPAAPVEDADNNVFLDTGSPLQRSPKKKYVVHTVYRAQFYF